jgi:hypothetical protein
MALYFTDFSEYTAGSQPSDFTERWDTAAVTATVETVSGTSGGVALRFVSGSGPAAISWDEIDGDPDRDDVEILTRTRRTTTAGSNSMGVLARAVNLEATRTGYFSTISGGLRTDRYLNGGYSSFSSTSFAIAFEVWYYVRARFNGTNVKLKAWSGDLVDEPSDWGIETTNSDISGAGWVGFFNFHDGTIEYDFLGVGTNGDQAPSSAPTPGLETPINPSITDLLATSARLNWEQG